MLTVVRLRNVTCSSIHPSHTTRAWQANFAGWGLFAISSLPTSGTTLISASGRGRFRRQSHGLRRAFVGGPQRGIEVHFTRDLEEHAPLEWHDEIDQTLIPGGIFKEFVFFHEASGTLILADTIMNLDLDKIDEPWRTATKLTGMYHPNGQIFFGMRLPILLQRKKARAAFRKLWAWDPQRIVLSHGHCFDSNADKVVGRLFRQD